jgi:hypothetical protein
MIMWGCIIRYFEAFVEKRSEGCIKKTGMQDHP